MGDNAVLGVELIGDGLLIYAAGSTAEVLSISGSVRPIGGNDVVQGNFIGLDATGANIPPANHVAPVQTTSR